jgi:hypothetical protein
MRKIIAKIYNMISVSTINSYKRAISIINELKKTYREGSRETLSLQKEYYQLENDIIKSGNAKLCYLLATKINPYVKINVKGLEHVVIDSRDPEICTYFAHYVKASYIDVDRLQQVVVESKNPQWCYLFAKTVAGANINVLRRCVESTGNKKWITAFDTLNK